jgi:hypothetical protein
MSYDGPCYVTNFGTPLIWVNILTVLDKCEVSCLNIHLQNLLEKGVQDHYVLSDVMFLGVCYKRN